MVDDDEFTDPLAPRMTGDFDTATSALTRILQRLNRLTGNKDGLINELGYIEAGIKQAEARRIAAEKTVLRLQAELDESRVRADALAGSAKVVASLERELEEERNKRAALASRPPPAPPPPPLAPWLVALVESPARLAAVGGAALIVVTIVAAVTASWASADDDLAVLQETHGQILARLEERPRDLARAPAATAPADDGNADEVAAADDHAVVDDEVADDSEVEVPAEDEPPPAAAAAAPAADDAETRFVVVHSSSPAHAEALRIRERAYAYLQRKDSTARVCLTTPTDGRELIVFFASGGLTKKDAIVWAYRLTTTRDSGTTFSFPDRMPPPEQLVDCLPAD